MATANAIVQQAPELAGELRGCATVDIPGGPPLSWLVPAGITAHWQARPHVWRLPGASGPLRGITYWLGRVAPVFDVGAWLAPARSADALEHILLLALPRGPAALRVRAAPDLVQVDRADPGAPPADVPAPLHAFLHRRRRLDGGAVHEFAVESWLMQALAARATQEAP